VNGLCYSVGRWRPDAGSLLWCLRANHDERASSRASWAADCSFIDEGHRTSARTAICDHKHLVLITFGSAGCPLAIGTRNPHGVRSARRTFRALETGRSRWPCRARRSRRTYRARFAFFTRRSDRTGIALRALTSCYANGERDYNCNTSDVHAGTSHSVLGRPDKHKAAGLLRVNRQAVRTQYPPRTARRASAPENAE
jgi:hypothetical protein